MRLRTSLLLLVFAATIPVVGFAIVASTLLVNHEEENYAEAVKARNRAFMSAVDAELSGSITTLQALATARTLANGDLHGFHEDAAAVLGSQPGWLNIILHDPDGRQIVSARLPWGAELPPSVETDSLERVIRTVAPAIGSVERGPQGLYGIPLRVPVVRSGRTAYILTGILRPEAFQALVVKQQLPQGWVSGLVDGKGRFIARTPPKPVGSPASRDYRAAVARNPEGWYRGSTVEGLDTFTAHATSALSGWSVGFAIPASLVLAGARHYAILMTAGVLASLALAAAIALWLGRRIAQPMTQLAAGALALGSGKPRLDVRSSLLEVNEVRKALDTADGMLRERESELRTRASDLQRADRNKSQFLALLSHELRNPLAPLLNGLSLLGRQRDPGLAAATREMMQRQVAHLRRLIDDLLDVSRIDRGKLELQRERVAIDAVIRNAIDTSKPNIEAKAQALLVRYAPEPLFVEGDPVRLSQVVANLLNNAAKFTPAGGQIEIGSGAHGAEAVVSVKDSGVGFAASDAGRIFDMFVQLDTSRAQAAGGLGLGLTLARALVEMHGGRIEAESAGPGRGAEFRFYLPLAAPLAAPAPAARPAAQVHGKRILVVDDNTDAADSLEQLLRLEGHDTRACYDGARAIEVFRSHRPEIAFLDLNMPGIDGLALARRLRAESAGRPLKLIALTGMGQRADHEATRAAGFDAHLTKPATVEAVLAIVAGEPGENVLPFDRTAS